MAVSQLQRTIVVIGATGRQGGGVVKALLSDKSVSGDPWLVRGFTSDPGSDKAKQLLSDLQTEDGRLSLVRGSVYDVQSLLSAFAGAYGVFAMTDQGYPGRVLVEEEELKHELDAGRNLIDAAKERGIKHFVFSSTPSISKASGGRFTKVFHMDHKYAIEQMASAELDGFTAIIPGT